VSDTEISLPETAGLQAEFVVGGMTCGACAARIERRLNRLDGVAATVNYATGRAYFASTGGRDPAELIGVIESAGYTAEPPAPPSPDGPPARRRPPRRARSGWRTGSPRCSSRA
jgi:P-type Cu+ transporter